MTWQEALQDYFDKLKPEQQQWLQKWVLLDAPLLAEIEDTETLIALFKRNGRLVHTALLRTLVWQTLGLVLAGLEDPIRSNIRTFWYNFVDPLYSRHDLYKEVRDDDPSFQKFLEQADEELLRGPEDQVKKTYTSDLNEQTLQEFVLAGIFKYSGPFQFEDSNATQLVGRGTASIVLVCEKEGLFSLIRQAYENHGISVMCSNGNPSTLSLEQFTDQLKAKKIVNVSMGCLVDYDPKGYEIACDYSAKFQVFGLKLRSFTILTSLELFTEKALAEDSYALPKPEGKAAKAWFEKTGGINGEKRGIHLNKATKPRIRKAWTRWIAEQKED
jgi:hypothetical protein